VDGEPQRALPVKAALVQLATGHLPAAIANTRTSYPRSAFLTPARSRRSRHPELRARETLMWRLQFLPANNIRIGLREPSQQDGQTAIEAVHIECQA